MARVRRRDKAREQLEEIWVHIASDNAPAADRLLDRIDKALFGLAEQPKMGRLRTELGNDIRSFIVGRYILFYREIPEGILLIAVIHGSHDIGPDDFPDQA
jgi:toxin ParE1/3/4